MCVRQAKVVPVNILIRCRTERESFLSFPKYSTSALSSNRCLIEEIITQRNIIYLNVQCRSSRLVAVPSNRQ